MFTTESTQRLSTSCLVRQNLGVTKSPHPTFARLLSYVTRAGGEHVEATPEDGIEGAVRLRLGVTAGRFTNWKTRGLSQQGALLAQKKFGCSANWLLTGIGDEVAPAVGEGHQDHGSATVSVEVEDAPTLRARVRVPLVGEVKGGTDGYLEETQYPVGVGEGFILYPTSDEQAYALRVRGDSMHPRYRHGEFVVVEPSYEPLPGDDVVVRCHDGRKLLKEFGWKRGEEVQLRSINDGFEPTTLLLAEVATMHLVAGRARSGALQMHD